MAALKNLLLAVLMAAFVLKSAGPAAGAEIHHVVGGDRGWDVDSDIAAWLAGRIFRVGDKIWFAYSAAHGNVVELKSKEKYEACDVNNFIRMYTDGVDIVALDGEGIRYFASSKAESCKKGLKLHVQVQAQAQAQQKTETTGAERMNDVSVSDSAAPPSVPSTTSPPCTPISYLTLTIFCVWAWAFLLDQLKLL